MGCAVGLEAIALLERERYEDVSAALGEHLMEQLRTLQARYPDRIGDVRGHGLMVGAELVRSAHGRAPDGGLALAVMRRMLEQGVLLLPSGVHGQVLSFTPPFVITRDEIDRHPGRAHRRRGLSASAPTHTWAVSRARGLAPGWRGAWRVRPGVAERGMAWALLYLVVQPGGRRGMLEVIGYIGFGLGLGLGASLLALGRLLVRT
jgi:hypothetical protein